MLSHALSRAFIGLLLGLAGAGMALAAELAPIDQVQVHACRATSSLLLYRGEGFQETHKDRFEADLQALDAALQAVPQPSDGLRQKYRALVTQLQQGVSYGHNEEDVPWRFPQELAKSLRDQGEPQYLEDVTAGGDKDGDGGDLYGDEGGGSGDDLYDRAVAVVTRDRKASTSYIQRRLQIGYNRAATLIERMEQEGVVSPANHAGKRDILAGPPP